MGLRGSGESARVAPGDLAGAGCHPGFEQDDRLSRGECGAACFYEAPRLAEALGEDEDHPRAGVADEELDQVLGRRDGLVSRRHHIAEAQPAAAVHQDRGGRAALRDHSDVAGGDIERQRHAAERDRVGQAERAHAVRADQHRACLLAHRAEGGLALCPERAVLGEPGGMHDERPDSELDPFGDDVRDMGCGNADDGSVGYLRQRRQAGPAPSAEHLSVPRVDQGEVPGVVQLLIAADGLAHEPAGVRSTDQG